MTMNKYELEKWSNIYPSELPPMEYSIPSEIATYPLQMDLLRDINTTINQLSLMMLGRIKNVSIAFCIICFSICANAQAVFQTMQRLPDTGQNTSCTTTFGEDADYNINSPFFTLNGNGTVTDTVTSLMWQQTDGGEMIIENAQIYCDNLTLGGYTDWRLPNCHELFSILNHDKVNPAADTNYFTKTLAEYWWSNELQVNDANKVWVTNAGGGVGNHPKTETMSAGGQKRFHVRAVRDVSPATLLPNHFIDNGDGTTTDLLTELTWQQIPSADSITWEQALSLANALSYAGYSDWRLPNIKELQSINDESLSNPSINQTFFNGVNANHYWSSTSLPNQTSRAWYLETQYGVTSYQFKTNKLYALCVRGGNLAAGIQENNSTQNDMMVYPNPSAGTIHILNENSIDELRITNLVGQLVFQSNPKLTNISVNINSTGIYFVTIASGNVISTKKIMIQD